MRPLPHPHRRAATRRAPHLALLLALPQCGRSPTQTGHDPPPPTVHTDRASPPDHTLAGITEIVAAGAMTCGLTPDAQVLCWGSLAGLDRHFVRPVAIPRVTPAHGPGGDPPHLWAGWDGF